MTTLMIKPFDLLVGDTVRIPTGYTEGPDNTQTPTYELLTVDEVVIASPGTGIATAIYSGGSWVQLPNEATYEVERP